MGYQLLDQLKMIDNPLIGDVRGKGLFIGIELVKNSNLLTPAADEANSIVNYMKDSGILISADGPDHNVLKIKPPIIFTHENADELVYNLKLIINQYFSK